MTPIECIQLVGGWPRDRTVPSKLAAAIKEASGEEQEQLKSLVEALYAASETTSDLELIEKHFGQ